MNEEIVYAKHSTPVLNTPHFKNVFGKNNSNSLLLDEKGHMRSLEYVALKNEKFTILKRIPEDTHYIYKVKAEKYNYESLFVDSRFVTKTKNPIIIKRKTKNEIINELISYQGSTYIWGSNCKNGILELLNYYPPTIKLDNKTKNHWILKGVDCSGLLYEVMQGQTPRNTSELMFFGNQVGIENKNTVSILNIIKPLDLLVFLGHVIIIINKNMCIESKEHDGVIISSFEKRLKEISNLKRPKNINITNKVDNNCFVIRRWF